MTRAPKGAGVRDTLAYLRLVFQIPLPHGQASVGRAAWGTVVFLGDQGSYLELGTGRKLTHPGPALRIGAWAFGSNKGTIESISFQDNTFHFKTTHF